MDRSLQYLSYSGFKTYMTCPKKYHYKYIEKEPIIFDPRSSLFGSAIGKIFEWFYMRKIWAEPNPVTAACTMIGPAMTFVFEKEKFSPSSDPGFVELIRSDLEKFVPTGVNIIRDHKLLSDNSHAELDLTINVTKDDVQLRLGKCADFVHWTNNGSWILDGKASAKREAYADPIQLIWYAMLHYLKYGSAPVRLGFIYWRFPQDPVQWIDYDTDTIRNLHSQVFEVAKKVRLKVFDPTPSSACKICDYRMKCDVGFKHVAALKVESGGRIESSIFDLEFA